MDIRLKSVHEKMMTSNMTELSNLLYDGLGINIDEVDQFMNDFEKESHKYTVELLKTTFRRQINRLLLDQFKASFK